MRLKDIEDMRTPIAVIGLGYVGLPLACLLSQRFKVVGFDIDQRRVDELRKGIDRTHEVTEKNILLNKNLQYSTDASVLNESHFIIVTVPTPVDQFKKPDLTPLLRASETIGRHLNKGAIVVFESTVYPGCTENECHKMIEQHSGMVCNRDFFLGYSPERVNPGDKKHTIEKIKKVVSASTKEALEVVAGVYGSVIQAGIHLAPNIATAEAAKVIENTQRDLNIALINELAIIFEKFGIDTQDVLACSRTKWNFLDFSPGLVGGHCIGVDPYYLTYMAEGLGINPQVILAGRRINDNMGTFIGQKIMKLILGQKKLHQDMKVAICGVTFKENVPDLRNSKVVDVIQSLEEFGVKVYCVDPVCDPADFEDHYSRQITSWQDLPPCDAVVMAVKHEIFKQEFGLPAIAAKLKSDSKILVDLKGLFTKEEADALGLVFWRL